MYNDEVQEQAFDREPRVGMGMEIAGKPKRMTLLEMAEQEMAMLEKLNENIRILADKLEPVRDEMPSDSVEGKMSEPQMNKMEGRLQYIINQTRRAVNNINSLTREVNL